MAKNKAANQQYLRTITGRFTTIPKMIGSVAASRVFDAMVNLTHIDSGQAALNWRVVVHEGDFVEDDPDLMWGWGDTSPIPPAGYKGDQGMSAEAIIAYQVDQRETQAAWLEDQKGAVFTVYNPISPGAFLDFAPGDDTSYEETALGHARRSWEWVSAQAVREAEQIVAARLGGVLKA